MSNSHKTVLYCQFATSRVSLAVLRRVVYQHETTHTCSRDVLVAGGGAIFPPEINLLHMLHGVHSATAPPSGSQHDLQQQQQPPHHAPLYGGCGGSPLSQQQQQQQLDDDASDDDTMTEHLLQPPRSTSSGISRSTYSNSGAGERGGERPAAEKSIFAEERFFVDCKHHNV